MKEPDQKKYNPLSLRNSAAKSKKLKTAIITVASLAVVSVLVFGFFDGWFDDVISEVMVFFETENEVFPSPPVQAITTPPPILIEPTDEIRVGSVVVIIPGAVYGGAAQGREVPSVRLAPRTHTVYRIDLIRGEDAALLDAHTGGLNSWVPLRYLRLE
jgi:hypothetical protein